MSHRQPRQASGCRRALTASLDHLGRAYGQFLKLLLAGVGHLQQLGSATNDQLHRQLVDSRKQNERLIAAFIESQGDLLKVERESLHTQKAQAQMQLGQQALRTFDDATRLYLMTQRGLPPELQGVVSAVSGSPELMQALSNPRVQALLADPQQRQQLAALLQMAAQQVAAASFTPQAPAPAAG